MHGSQSYFSFSFPVHPYVLQHSNDTFGHHRLVKRKSILKMLAGVQTYMCVQTYILNWDRQNASKKCWRPQKSGLYWLGWENHTAASVEKLSEGSGLANVTFTH